MEVRQRHRDLGHLGVALEDRPADDPDRGLDRRAVVVGEHLEERRAHALEEGVVVDVRRGVPPASAHLGRHEPVGRLGQRRVLVAGEAR